MMKNLITFSVLLLFLCTSCENDDFDLKNPNVEQFVRQIKNGSYNKFEFSGNGERLWTEMPQFKVEHIPILINFSNDTSLISPFDHIPLNPVSSIPPYRMSNGKACIMVGEYLLWCIEGIIEGTAFASLTPILLNQTYTEDERLNGKEIIEVSKLYQNWWEESGKFGNMNKLPLDDTVYKWR